MDALYQEQILAFAKAARSTPPVSTPDRCVTISNPTCGDRVEISITLDGPFLSTAGAAVRGCALCEAGTGLFLRISPGLDLNQINQLHDGFASWLVGDDNAPIHPEMTKFMPVREIRNRHTCVLLSFEAAVQAMT